MAQSLEEMGRQIRDARRRKALSVSALARKLQISGPYVSVLERGARRPMPRLVLRLADVLDLPIHDLISLAGYGYDAETWPPRVLLELVTGERDVTQDEVAMVRRALRRYRVKRDRGAT
jgi:transcriptional regulator with XRE-family HTH domain